MSGQHRVAHFFNGRETPASDVIQVSTISSIIIEHHLLCMYQKDLYRLMKLTKEYQSLFALWIMSKDFGKS